jgi:hypothetical protein
MRKVDNGALETELMLGQGTATIKVRGRLAERLTDDSKEVAAGQTVLEAAQGLGISPGQALVAIVNGQTQDLGYRLRPNDLVWLMSPISGGGV